MHASMDATSISGCLLSCSAEVCQFRERIEGHMFRMKLLKVVQSPPKDCFVPLYGL
jgi:hypothetical protein